MQFSLTVSQSWNFCAADLMNRYAMNKIGVYFARDHFYNAFLSIHGGLIDFVLEFEDEKTRLFDCDLYSYAVVER